MVTPQPSFELFKEVALITTGFIVNAFLTWIYSRVRSNTNSRLSMLTQINWVILDSVSVLLHRAQTEERCKGSIPNEDDGIETALRNIHKVKDTFRDHLTGGNR